MIGACSLLEVDACTYRSCDFNTRYAVDRYNEQREMKAAVGIWRMEKRYKLLLASSDAQTYKIFLPGAAYPQTCKLVHIGDGSLSYSWLCAVSKACNSDALRILQVSTICPHY